MQSTFALFYQVHMGRKTKKLQGAPRCDLRRLAELRKRRGITQKELARQLGVTQTVISQYERGQVRLHAELIARLSHILRVSSDELLGLRPCRDGEATINRRFLRRLRLVDQLPLRDQEALLKTIDAYLLKLRLNSDQGK